jgi:glycine/D-amino acid oxidase-like deaminating enzyme
MDRRAVLRALAGVTLSGVPSLAFQTSRRDRDRVVIAGGGILGANIAYQLARRGASVTLVEKAKPASGATANSFAWINAQKQPLEYYRLSHVAIEAWRELQREIGDLPVQWGGSVQWTDTADGATRLTDTVRRFEEWGYPIHLIGEDRLKGLEGRVVPGAVANASHAEIEGNLDPVAATEVILAAATKAGARIRYPAEVIGLDLQGGTLRAVKTTEGEVPADVLVVACGVDTPKVAAMAGLDVELTRSPGILVHTHPLPRTVDRIVLSPLGNIKQKPNGRIVTGLDFGPTKETDTTREYGERFLHRMSAVLPQLGTAAVDKVTLGFRPMPKDSHPIVGFPAGRRDIYLTVMHSGVTLGALVGRLASAEILDNVDVNLLAPFRLERFNGGRG